MPSRQFYVARACEAILALLNEEHAVVWPEVEAKLAQLAPPRKRIDTHHVSSARRRLTNEKLIEEWRRLLVAHAVTGVQVHDARLAAAMHVYGVPHLLTFNTGDFRRYPEITAVYPQDV